MRLFMDWLSALPAFSSRHSDTDKVRAIRDKILHFASSPCSFGPDLWISVSTDLKVLALARIPGRLRDICGGPPSPSKKDFAPAFPLSGSESEATDFLSALSGGASEDFKL